MSVEPGLVFRVEPSEQLGVLVTDVVVAGGEVCETPVNQLVCVMHLRSGDVKWKW